MNLDFLTMAALFGLVICGVVSGWESYRKKRYRSFIGWLLGTLTLTTLFVDGLRETRLWVYPGTLFLAFLFALLQIAEDNWEEKRRKEEQEKNR